MKYEGWLKFFFHSVSEQLKETQELISSINKLYDEIYAAVAGFKSPNLYPFLEYIFEHPIFYPSSVEGELGVTYVSVRNLVEHFVKKEILKPLKNDPGSDQRIKLYSFHKLLSLLQG